MRPSLNLLHFALANLAYRARADPESLQLTVSCQKTVPGDLYIKNFAKAADLLMDLFEQAERDGQGKAKA